MDDEVFAIRIADDRYYLYAPLRRAVANVNGDAVRAAAYWRVHGRAPRGRAGAVTIRALLARGVLSSAPTPAPVFPPNLEFRPHEVTLFLTSRCNLRCRYCYADAGHKSVDLPWPVARAAIDLVVRNAGFLGSGNFGVGFHGGGEPTLAWQRLRRCVEYARRKAADTGLKAEIYAATNGVLSKPQCAYIVRHFSTVTVSLDGPPDVQNALRPTRRGTASYPSVARTLRHFRQAGFPFGVRTTVTAETVARMPEIVRHLHEAFGLTDLHMEPAWACGRCATTGLRPPRDERFLRYFGEAVELGRRLGMRVHYSGARLDVLTSKFCAAAGDGFCVLPEGGVTSCFEVTEPDDPRAAVFHYGHYDAESRAFRFDPERLANLRRLSVEHLPHCRDCFCRWHCAGDCVAKAFRRSGTAKHHGTSRCALNRQLTLRQIEEVLAAEASVETETSQPTGSATHAATTQ
jgi:uncharacterized protein